MTDSARQIVYRSTGELQEHPRNQELFGEIDEADGSWKEFVESIQTRGILHPLVISSRNVVISGWRRLTAAKTIGMTTVPCTILENSEDVNSPEVLLALIDCNVKQRGGMKYLAVEHQRKITRVVVDCLKKQKQLVLTSPESVPHREYPKNIKQEAAKILGSSEDWVHRLERISTICPSLLEEIDSGHIPMRTASDILSKLSPAEQETFASSIPSELAESLTRKQVEERVAQIKADSLKAISIKDKEMLQLKAKLDSSTPERLKQIENDLAEKERALVEVEKRAEGLERMVRGQTQENVSPPDMPEASVIALLRNAQQVVEFIIPDPLPYASLQKDVIALMTSLKELLDKLVA